MKTVDQRQRAAADVAPPREADDERTLARRVMRKASRPEPRDVEEPEPASVGSCSFADAINSGIHDPAPANENATVATARAV